MKKITDKEYMERFLQDLQVKARDIEDFTEKKKISEIIDQFDKGIKQEYE